MKSRLASSFRHRARQRGTVLIVALIVMVATILAAIALRSSVDVATLISGNLAFRQSGVQVADIGVEKARNWLMAQSNATLSATAPATGYYATANGGAPANTPFEPTDSSFPWTVALPSPIGGNTVAYVIHRMCDNDGDPNDPVPANRPNCFIYEATLAGGVSNRIKDTGAGDFACIDPNTGNNLCGSVNNPYYRITVRVTGPRSTVTYVQAVIY